MRGLAIAWTGLVGLIMAFLGFWMVVEGKQMFAGSVMAVVAALCIVLAVMLTNNKPGGF